MGSRVDVPHQANDLKRLLNHQELFRSASGYFTKIRPVWWYGGVSGERRMAIV